MAPRRPSRAQRRQGDELMPPTLGVRTDPFPAPAAKRRRVAPPPPGPVVLRSGRECSGSPATQGLTPTPQPGRVASPGPGAELGDDYQRVQPHADGPEPRKPLDIPRGRYTAVQHLSSEGAFGHVYFATASVSGRPVVLKQQNLESSVTGEVAYRELRCLAHLSLVAPHPSIIEVLDCWEVGNELYIVEERLEMTLTDWIWKRVKCAKSRGVPYEIATVQRRRLMTATWSGLAHLHACNIVHRDFKPQNIVVDDDLGRVKLIDLGSCRRPLLPGERECGPSPMTKGRYVCTYPYRAPEIYTDETMYTAKVDVWSAACICAEVSLGRKLFKSPERQIPEEQREFGAQMGTDPAAISQRMRVVFPKATIGELKMFAASLRMDPEQRCTSLDALTYLKLPSYAPQSSGYDYFSNRGERLEPPHYLYEDLKRIRSLIGEELNAWNARRGRGSLPRPPVYWDCEMRGPRLS